MGVDMAKSSPEIDKAIKEFQRRAKIQAEIKLNSSGIAKSQKDVQGLSSSMTKLATESQRLSKLNTILAWASNNSKAVRALNLDIDSFQRKLSNPNLSLTEFKQLDAQFKQIQISARETGNLGKSLGDSFADAGKKFASWATISGLIMSAVNSARKMKDAVFDVDTAMTNLYKVTDETSSRYALFLKNANKSAQELGQSVSNLVEQTANWAKLGFSISEAENLAKVSSIYANVGEVDNKTAVSDLVTALKAFNIESSKSITIVDSLNKLGKIVARR